MRELHPHQTLAIDMLRQSLGKGKKRPMLQAPTGFGKTLLGAAIVEGALRKGKRVIFAVPALSLVDQTVAAFWAEGIRDVGVIQGAHEMTNWNRPVQVASVQTLQRRPLPEADVVMIDEAHRWFDFYGKWMAQDGWRSVPFIGLSATPWTKGLGKHFDDLLIAATTTDLIDGGYLSPFRVFAPSHPDLTGVRTIAGDYHEGELSEAMSPLVADIVETWRRQADGRPTLCFGVDRAHAKGLQKRFIEAGVSTEYIDAFTDMEEREAIRKRFHAGDVQVVCNVGCLTTGVDWDVRCIVLARPTKSEMLFTQIVGRGLRTASGKEDCLILDHSDTHLRLGFVTDIHHDTLDDGKPRTSSSSEPEKKPAPLPKECPKCTFLKPAKVHVCPSCGFKPEKQAEIETAEGELVELNGKKSPRADMVTKQRWYSMFLGIAQTRGYKDGWAANQYRQKFGVWPQGLARLAIEADGEVASYVRASMIRYAKRKAA